jgi:hypothetical protein
MNPEVNKAKKYCDITGPGSGTDLRLFEATDLLNLTPTKCQFESAMSSHHPPDCG